MSTRANALADRIEQGAEALASFAESLSDSEWQTPIPGDERSVGVVVHHVANMYPIEIDLAEQLGAGKAIEGVTWDAVAGINAKHHAEHRTVGKAEAVRFLRERSKEAAKRVRNFTDEQLDGAAPVSLYADAPLTAQFFIEDHALRHSTAHLAEIRAALGR